MKPRAAADCPSGCQPKPSSIGFSSRIMWRDGGDLVSYMYLPGDNSLCGQDWKYGGSKGSSSWQRAEIYTKMNTPGMVPPLSLPPACLPCAASPPRGEAAVLARLPGRNWRACCLGCVAPARGVAARAGCMRREHKPRAREAAAARGRGRCSPSARHCRVPGGLAAQGREVARRSAAHACAVRAAKF